MIHCSLKTRQRVCRLVFELLYLPQIHYKLQKKTTIALNYEPEKYIPHLHIFRKIIRHIFKYVHPVCGCFRGVSNSMQVPEKFLLLNDFNNRRPPWSHPPPCLHQAISSNIISFLLPHTNYHYLCLVSCVKIHISY